jgi:serine protease inhibitor
VKVLQFLVGSLAIICGACHSSSGQCTPREEAQCDLSCQQVAVGINQFGLDLYRHLATPEQENLCFSPLSISAALSMAYIGAEGESASEMAAVLHYPTSQGLVARSFGLLKEEIDSRGQGQIYTANGLWLQKGISLESPFADAMSRDYCGNLHQIDFAKSPQKSVAAINRWVADQTEERIQEILEPSDITLATRLALVATLYLKAAWKAPFQSSQTQLLPFYLEGGATISTETMHQEGSFGYYEGEQWAAARLPYATEEEQLAMWIFLPTQPAGLAVLEEALSTDLLKAIYKGFTQEQVDLLLPKFHIEARFNLGESLSDMGMRQPFSMRADFSGINGKRDLRLQQVIHQTVVEVDEEGTEAAAATVATIGLKAIPPQLTKSFHADHPFIFFIIDEELQLIYFIGRVINPALLYK